MYGSPHGGFQVLHRPQLDAKVPQHLGTRLVPPANGLGLM